MATQFKSKSFEFVSNAEKSAWHDKALWFVRSKRDVAVNKVENWEELRQQASLIKDHCLSQLDEYLELFEKNALENNVHVHWAKDANEHNRIVGEILEKNKVNKLVKSKSMLTEECGLNEYLEKKGIEVVDTDLGERIIQLKGDPPSHIVLPAIHMKKEEVSALFNEKLGTEKGNNDPTYLTHQARLSLRQDFLEAQAALTGVNFAVAETGEIVICTNEGNADVGLNIVPLKIHSMGIEKLLPRHADLGVFTRMLARNATGQDITVYTSHYKRPKPGEEMHIVLVDNGRSNRLGEEDFRASLKCIRCGACLNTCPIYRRSGGHSYGYTIPGPIGAILSPNIDLKKYNELPFASSLCGSCTDVCPVKIDIHVQLYRWRQVMAENKALSPIKGLIMGVGGWLISKPVLFSWMMGVAKVALTIIPPFILYNRLNTWGKGREMPKIRGRKKIY